MVRFYIDRSPDHNVYTLVQLPHGESRETRAREQPGAAVNRTKRLLSAQLGRALADSDLHASLLVVLCSPSGGAGTCPSSTSSRIPAPPSLAAAGSVSALVGPQARGDKHQEVELRNLHLIEPDDGGTEDGYEEDDEGDEGDDASSAAHPPAAGGGNAHEGRARGWGRQLSMRRGLSTSSARSLVSLEELMEQGTIIPS